MRHLIERVLELSDEEIVPQLDPQPSGQGTDELRALLESLSHESVYGVGGAGCNAVGRLDAEGLFANSFVTLRHQYRCPSPPLSPLEHKVLIGRTARGRGAGGDPTKGEAAALNPKWRRGITTDTQLAIIAAGMGGGSVLERQVISHDWQKNRAP